MLEHPRRYPVAILDAPKVARVDSSSAECRDGADSKGGDGEGLGRIFVCFGFERLEDILDAVFYGAHGRTESSQSHVERSNSLSGTVAL